MHALGVNSRPHVYFFHSATLKRLCGVTDESLQAFMSTAGFVPSTDNETWDHFKTRSPLDKLNDHDTHTPENYTAWTIGDKSLAGPILQQANELPEDDIQPTLDKHNWHGILPLQSTPDDKSEHEAHPKLSRFTHTDALERLRLSRQTHPDSLSPVQRFAYDMMTQLDSNLTRALAQETSLKNIINAFIEDTAMNTKLSLTKKPAIVGDIHLHSDSWYALAVQANVLSLILGIGVEEFVHVFQQMKWISVSPQPECFAMLRVPKRFFQTDNNDYENWCLYRHSKFPASTKWPSSTDYDPTRVDAEMNEKTRKWLSSKSPFLHYAAANTKAAHQVVLRTVDGREPNSLAQRTQDGIPIITPEITAKTLLTCEWPVFQECPTFRRMLREVGTGSISFNALLRNINHLPPAEQDQLKTVLQSYADDAYIHADFPAYFVNMQVLSEHGCSALATCFIKAFETTMRVAEESTVTFFEEHNMDMKGNADKMSRPWLFMRPIVLG
jgi:hypothetical protein